MDKFKKYRRSAILEAKPITRIAFYGEQNYFPEGKAEEIGYLVKEKWDESVWYSKEAFNNNFIEVKGD